MSANISDSDWVSLRQAARGFEPRWREYTTQPQYDASLPYCSISEFVTYVWDLYDSSSDNELDEVLVAVEALLSWATPALVEFITIGFFEGFVDKLEDGGRELWKAHSRLKGPHSQHAWRRAVAYTHPEMQWVDREGLFYSSPPPSQIGTFIASQTLIRSEAREFVIVGHLRAGTVAAGDSVRMQITRGMHTNDRIVAVEDLPGPDGKPQTGLVIRFASFEEQNYLEAMYGSAPFEPIELAITQ